MKMIVWLLLLILSASLLESDSWLVGWKRCLFANVLAISKFAPLDGNPTIESLRQNKVTQLLPENRGLIVLGCLLKFRLSLAISIFGYPQVSSSYLPNNLRCAVESPRQRRKNCLPKKKGKNSHCVSEWHPSIATLNICQETLSRAIQCGI